MKRLPKDLKTMSVDALRHEYVERRTYLDDLAAYLWDYCRWHSEPTVAMVAKNQSHTKTAQKYFQLHAEIERIETIAAYRGCALEKG